AMKDKKFFAFISYQRQDEEYAEWLRKKLEHYRLPSSLREKDASLPKEIRPIFRDALELTGGFLAQEIEQALEQSKFLIVICSPRSARSPWVNKEVEYFIQSGRTQYIIPYIIDGEPFAQDESNECFPPALRALTANNELLGINMNELGRDAAAIKVVARMFGLRFDTLWQRYEREQRRNRWLVVGGALLFAVVSLAIGGYIYRNNWKMLEIQSRFVAEKAIALADAGDSYTARLLCLDILPHDLNNPDRPYTPEADIALRYACEHNSGTLRGHTAVVMSATFSPDGKYIISASDDETLKIWDTQTGKCIKTLVGHTSWIRSANFSHDPDGKYIVSASDDETLKIWDTQNWECTKTLEGHTNWVNSATFSTDGKYIVSASGDKTLKIWDTQKWECIKTLEGHTSSVNSATFSPDEKYIVSASSDETIKIWSTENWECIETLEGHTDEVNSATFSTDPDGRYIVSASRDNTIKIWDTQRWECIKTLEGHTRSVYSANFSTDGKYIVSASDENTLKIWNTENWECIKTLEGHTNAVTSATFSTDGKYIVSASSDSTIKIWSTENWECIKTLEGHTDIVNSANFSTDGRYIVSASSDSTLRIWDTENWECIKTLERHTSWVGSATFSPKGKYIVSASIDGTIRIWDTKTGSV
ncbi:MAG: TIR domain-containing protein, partial [Bacteroidaceae bacterium]|nr:TIR domain-containing protein [Bacteroidaceae bacterium]